MARSMEGGAGGGQLALSDILKPIVARRLDGEAGRISPASYGRQIRSKLTVEEITEVGFVQDQLLDAALSEEVRRQTRPKPHPNDGKLFPDHWLDEWISAAIENDAEEDAEPERIKVRHAQWADHLAYRENQIKHMRRANRSFEIAERRRTELSRAGMSADPEMTTEDALKVLSA